MITLTVSDTIPVKKDYSFDGKVGLVIVMEYNDSKWEEFAGKFIHVTRPDNSTISATVDIVKKHESNLGFFVQNLVRENVPIGSTVTVGGETPEVA